METDPKKEINLILYKYENFEEMEVYSGITDFLNFNKPKNSTQFKIVPARDLTHLLDEPGVRISQRARMILLAHIRM